MINPNELRKGNLLHFLIKNEHGGTVRARIETVLTTWQINKIDEMEDVDDFWAPIPLTPEWLERCGYTQDPIDRCYYNQSTRLGPLGIVKYGVYCMNGLPLSTKNIQYIHELQNTIFILTGEELQINHSTSASGTQ